MPIQRKSRPRGDRATQTRAGILRAAVREFSLLGFSGARVDAIARAARVNKALLYYHFRNKESLYAAALQEVSAEVVKSAIAALDPACSPGERLLRIALNHFDRILTQREFQSLMQQEMVRVHRGGSTAFLQLFRAAFRPLMERLTQTIEEGIHAGELCRVDPMQVFYSVFGANVFYFLSAPLAQTVLPFDPLSPHSLEQRRSAALLFLGTTLFSNRAHGARLAERLLAGSPMPQIAANLNRFSPLLSRRKPS